MILDTCINMVTPAPCVTWNAAEPLPGGGGGHRLLLLLLVARKLEKQAQDRLGGGHPVITLHYLG